MYSRIKLFGHPIHPMLVGFPVTLYAGTLVGYVLWATNASRFWLQFAIVCNIGAFFLGLVAAIPGLGDWTLGIPDGTEAKRIGFLHAMLNGVALTLFGVAGAMYYDDWFLNPSATPGVTLAAIGMVFVMAAGFLGWKLVQEHHVGVRLMPEQERIEMQVMPPMRRAV